MFEREAKRSFDELDDRGVGDDWSIEEAYEHGFSNGAEFGYNKVNEWHNLNENSNDLPDEGEWVEGLYIWYYKDKTSLGCFQS